MIAPRCAVRRIAGVPLLTALLLLTIPVPAVAEAGSVTRDGGPTRPSTYDDFMMLAQPYAKDMTAYNPMFFLLGTDLAKSTFQISFKYHFLDSSRPGRGWMDGMHFAYTQTSFWDLKDESLPFKDTSYKPELFYLSGNLAGRGDDQTLGFFLKGGAMHESNGQGGPQSRSTNYLYIEPIVIFYNPASRFGLRVSPRLWVYVGNSNADNPDLHAYRGYFRLNLKLGRADGVVVTTDLGWAHRGGSVKLDVTRPLNVAVFRDLRFFLHIQYTNVLAESLINYRKRTDVIRLGFSFVR